MGKYLLLLGFIVFYLPIYGQSGVKIGIQPQGHFTHYSKRLEPNGIVELEYWISPVLQFQRENNEIELIIGKSFGYSKVSPDWDQRSFIGLAYRRFFLGDFFMNKWKQNIQLTAKLQCTYQDWTLVDGFFKVSDRIKHYTILPSIGINFVVFKRFHLQFGWGMRFYESARFLDKQFTISYNL